jgi:hypothetical protein
MGGMVGEDVNLCNYLLSRFEGKIVSTVTTGCLPYVGQRHRHIRIARRRTRRAT